jgi:hypothetical protein
VNQGVFSKLRESEASSDLPHAGPHLPVLSDFDLRRNMPPRCGLRVWFGLFYKQVTPTALESSNSRPGSLLSGWDARFHSFLVSPHGDVVTWLFVVGTELGKGLQFCKSRESIYETRTQNRSTGHFSSTLDWIHLD